MIAYRPIISRSTGPIFAICFSPNGRYRHIWSRMIDLAFLPISSYKGRYTTAKWISRYRYVARPQSTGWGTWPQSRHLVNTTVQSGGETGCRCHYCRNFFLYLQKVQINIEQPVTHIITSLSICRIRPRNVQWSSRLTHDYNHTTDYDEWTSDGATIDIAG